MELVPGNTLITASPQEGRELAIAMARRTTGAIQPDADALGRVLWIYGGGMR